MLVKSRANACFEHSDFLKVTSTTENHQTIKPNETHRQKRQQNPVSYRNEPNSIARSPTTSVSTAAIYIYAIGAGITADAGTRLALQLFLADGFKHCSLQLPDS